MQQAGFTGLANGALTRRAVDAGYDVVLGPDRNLPSQENIRVSGIAIILVRGSRLQELAGRVDGIGAAVAAARPGTVTRVE